MERFSVEYTFYSVRHQFTFSFRHKVYSTCKVMFKELIQFISTIQLMKRLERYRVFHEHTDKTNPNSTQWALHLHVHQGVL